MIKFKLNLAPIVIGNQIVNKVLRNKKILSSEWLTYFNSTLFPFSADIAKMEH